ncbi:sigma 54-interacting transcriptional regulator, partial [Aeromonas caviae]|uniref:sigma 54-interacting transcriptional regulator n=1 Tax=Aeromonas caviae TaxID=648 RepID=UPI003EC6C909
MVLSWNLSLISSQPCSVLSPADAFGYQKGAFSGALANKTGLVAQANGGTLFLDEVG